MNELRVNELAEATKASSPCEEGERAILEDRVPRLEKELARLRKRAEKLGVECSLRLEFVGEPYWRKVEIAEGVRIRLRYQRVRVEGESPRLPGWEFLGTLTPLAAGTLVGVVPGAEIAEGELDRFRQGDARFCAHCNTVRNRKETFLVRRQETGAVLQVGRSCLKDYTGHPSGERLAILAGCITSMLRSLSLEDDDRYGIGGGYLPETWSVDTFLARTVATVRECGWRSRTKAREDGPLGPMATADVVLEDLGLLTSRDPGAREAMAVKSYCEQDTEDGVVVLEKVLAHLQAKARLSDYEQNLQVSLESAKLEGVRRKTAGIVASAVPFAHRLAREEAKLEAEKKNPSSVHFGVEGERGEWLLRVIRASEFEGEFGWKTCVAMQDLGGNLAVWWANRTFSEEELGVGSLYRVRASVKRHGHTKRGKAETTLLRATLVPLERAVAEAVAEAAELEAKAEKAHGPKRIAKAKAKAEAARAQATDLERELETETAYQEEKAKADAAEAKAEAARKAEEERQDAERKATDPDPCCMAKRVGELVLAETQRELTAEERAELEILTSFLATINRAKEAMTRFA